MKKLILFILSAVLSVNLPAQKIDNLVAIVIPGINTTNTVKLDDLLKISSFPASKEGYKITSFTISFTDKGVAVESTSTSNAITEDMRIVLGKIKDAKLDPVKLTFSNINGLNPKGKPILFPAKTIKVKK
jgi:hypothetical protein